MVLKWDISFDNGKYQSNLCWFFTNKIWKFSFFFQIDFMPPRTPPIFNPLKKRNSIIPQAPSDRDSIFIWRSSPPLGRWQAQYLLAALFLANPSGYGRLPTEKVGSIRSIRGETGPPQKDFLFFLLMEMIDGENLCEVFGMIAPKKQIG